MSAEAKTHAEWVNDLQPPAAPQWRIASRECSIQWGSRPRVMLAVEATDRADVSAEATAAALGGLDDAVRVALAGSEPVIEYQRLRSKLAEAEVSAEQLQDDLAKLALDQRALLRGDDAGDKLAPKLARLAAREGDLTSKLASTKAGIQALADAIAEAAEPATRAVRTARAQVQADRARQLAEQESALHQQILAAVAPLLPEWLTLAEARIRLNASDARLAKVDGILDGEPIAAETPVQAAVKAEPEAAPTEAAPVEAEA